jgi:hypothetical protein
MDELEEIIGDGTEVEQRVVDRRPIEEEGQLGEDILLYHGILYIIRKSTWSKIAISPLS